MSPPPAIVATDRPMLMMARATPSGQAHGFKVHAPYANARLAMPVTTATTPKTAASPKRPAVPVAAAANPPKPTSATPLRMPRTPPMADRTARTVIPIGRVTAGVGALMLGLCLPLCAAHRGMPGRVDPCLGLTRPERAIGMQDR